MGPADGFNRSGPDAFAYGFARGKSHQHCDRDNYHSDLVIHQRNVMRGKRRLDRCTCYERIGSDGCPVRRDQLHAGVHGPGRHGVEYSQCCCCAPAVAHCFACSESGQCCGGRDLDADLVIHQRDRVYGKRRLERYTRHERICNDRRFVRHDQVHVDVYGPRWFRVANRQRERDASDDPKKSGGGGAIDYALLSLLLGVGLRFGRKTKGRA